VANIDLNNNTTLVVSGNATLTAASDGTMSCEGCTTVSRSSKNSAANGSGPGTGSDENGKQGGLIVTQTGPDSSQSNDDQLSLGHLFSAGAFVGNNGVDAAAGAGIFFSDDAVGGTGFVAGVMNAGDIVSEGKTRGFEIGFDQNILVARSGFERIPDLSTVSLSFGISIKFFFKNHGQPLDLLSIRPNDLKGFSLGFGPGIGASIVDSIGRGGSFPVLK
jgi:hypothetical protein